jgi:glycosyltransferase involved in cell wall biosynthesis
MLRRAYYQIKPYVPWSLRNQVRGVLQRGMRPFYSEIWPVMESARHKPRNWPGWPDGRQFAFVLTHDVEGQRGLDRSRRLAELEAELGFRSCFNFIPEGEYRLPEELRYWLGAEGFEVGVHDLHHDGKLFNSAAGFSEKALRINRYLHDWRAQGFRAGFMLRNLSWYHQLDIAYDCSTFDTDPFEPQPDGTNTIFPLWVPRGQGKAIGPLDGLHQQEGYVELPYTLPQDSTMFLVMREKTPLIWTSKADWVASHGGMVLVNTHPDYMRFEGEPESPSTFPVSRYLDLLRHIKTQHEGRYAQLLPHQVNDWVRFHRSSGPQQQEVPSNGSFSASGEGLESALRGKRAAVLLYSSYPADPRPRRAAEAMVEAGMEVDLFSLAETDEMPLEETVRGVRIFRMRMKRRRGSHSSYVVQYGKFILSAFAFLTRRAYRRSYDVVHVHNMPDILVASALIPKLFGAKVILDLHDPMPELMECIAEIPSGHWKVGLLRWLERCSIGFSDLALTPNITFKNLFVSRGCPAEKMQIMMNTPEPELFDPDRVPSDTSRQAEEGVFRIMHHGSILHRHGVDLLVEAVSRLRPEIPLVRLDIYGAHTPFLDEVLQLAERLGIRDCLHYHGPKNHRQIAEAIVACDVGVVPNRRSPFTEINFPTRLFEYLSMGRPVIAPNTQGIRDYFDRSEMIYFEPNDVANMVERLLWVHRNRQQAADIVLQGLNVYRRHLWAPEKRRFIRLLSGLLQTSGE